MLEQLYYISSSLIFILVHIILKAMVDVIYKPHVLSFLACVRPLYHVIHLSHNYLGDHVRPHSVEFVSEVGVSGIGGPDDVEAIFP